MSAAQKSAALDKESTETYLLELTPCKKSAQYNKVDSLALELIGRGPIHPADRVFHEFTYPYLDVCSLT